MVPEYKSLCLTPSEREMYLVDGITDKRTLIAVYDKIAERFVPINGSYWTDSLVKVLKGG
ncbi:MAG TPA: hypothetical protein DEF39_14310 [Hungateiclostridium thermocellum]|nr:hypothetical protein EPD62_01450 [Acetivibrio thermocellus]HBW28402.1 hypothetical protein [Acetivibrio thermocellus]